MCICTYVRTYIHTYIHTYMHTYIYTYMYTHTHIYIYIYIYISGTRGVARRLRRGSASKGCTCPESQSAAK